MIIDVRPRYLSGKLHLGHALSYTQIDVYKRAYEKIKGDKVYYREGYDGNGLRIEKYVEEKYNLKPTTNNIPKLIEKCFEHTKLKKEEYGEQFKQLGYEYENPKYETHSPEYRSFIQKEFCTFYKNKIIKIKSCPVFWCIKCNTTLANSEVEYVQERNYLYKIPIKTREGDDYFYTSRPELMNHIIVFASNKEILAGKKVYVPILNKEFKIVYSEFNSKFEKDVFMVVGSDKIDLDILRKGKIFFKNYLKNNGKIKKIFKNILEFEKKEYLSEVPVCWRCKNRIEIKKIKSYIIEIEKYKKKLLKISEEYPFDREAYQKRIVSWIDNLKFSWRISRNRYFATRIRMINCTNCNKKDILVESEVLIEYRAELSCRRCNSKMLQNGLVLDTWFDSSSTRMYLSSKINDKSNSVLRFHSHDIIRSWHFYTLVKLFIYKKLKIVHRKYKSYITSFLYLKKGVEMHSSQEKSAKYLDEYVKKYSADQIRGVVLFVNPGKDLIFDEAAYKKVDYLLRKLVNFNRYFKIYYKKSTKIKEFSMMYRRKILKRILEGKYVEYYELILREVKALSSKISSKTVSTNSLYKKYLCLIDVMERVFRITINSLR